MLLHSGKFLTVRPVPNEEFAVPAPARPELLHQWIGRMGGTHFQI